MQEEVWRAQAFVRVAIDRHIAVSQSTEQPESLQTAYTEFAKRIAQVTYAYTSAQREPLCEHVLADIGNIVRETRVRYITVYWNGTNNLFPIIQCVAKHYQECIVDGILLPVSTSQ